MKYRLRLLSIVISLLFLGALFSNAEQVADNSTKPSYLFALSGTSGSVDGDTLTINGVTNVIYFSDRPERIAGHITLERFIGLWDKGSDSFKVDPPNAEISISENIGVKHDIVILTSPVVKDGTISFKVKSRGEDQGIPNSFGHSTLFVDTYTVNPMITDWL